MENIVTKKCNKCKKVKPLEDFNNSLKTKDGKGYQCRQCDSDHCKKYYREHKQERLDANRIYQEKNPSVYRASRYRRRYGITLEEYNTLLEFQKGVCAICGKPEMMHKQLVVDHDHKTGKVRGLLCTNCNKALGNAFDDVGVLRNMITYLLSWIIKR